MRNKEDVSLPRRQRPLCCVAAHSRPPVSVPFTVHTHCQPPRVRCSVPLRLPLRLCGERGRRRFGEDVWALRHSSVYLGREKSTMGAGQQENGLETLLDLPGAGQEGSSCPNGPEPRVGLTRKASSGGPDLGAARKGKSSSYLGCSYRQGGVVLRGKEDHQDQRRPQSPARLKEQCGGGMGSTLASLRPLVGFELLFRSQ